MIWISINDYSHKYKTSASTLRRRIREQVIPFRFEDGKYLLPDEPMDSLFRAHRPSLNSSDSAVSREIQFEKEMSEVFADSDSYASDVKPLPLFDSTYETSQLEKFINSTPPSLSSDSFNEIEAESKKMNENFLNQKLISDEVIQSLLGELKRAYASTLEGKEEQILQLKEEVTDLKTLVCVLESEVERLLVRPS